MTNYETLSLYLNSKTPCIWIHSYEEARVIDSIKRYCFENKSNAFLWSITSGLKKMQIIEADNDEPINPDFKNPDTLLGHIKEQATRTKNALWVLRDLSKAFQQYGFLYRHIRDLKEYAQTTSYQPIVVISPDKKIPVELEKLFVLIDFETLSKEELLKIVQTFSSKQEQRESKKHRYDDKMHQTVVNNLIGFTFLEVANIIKRSFATYNTFDLDFIMAEKIKLIQKTEVLEYHIPKAQFDHIGGNENFKEWVLTLEAAMAPEALAFGCSSPRGYLAVGVPGSGKTCLAEAIAHKLNIPYIKFNVARVMSRLVGESEKNMEEAIRLVKASAPCVFLIDEIEKVLGGSQSSNTTDGGTTARVMSTLLTFLAESNNGVLTIMTSNDITQLPPELTRAERLDAIW